MAYAKKDLALYGGPRAKNTPNIPMFPGGLEIGAEEKKEVMEVLDNKYLFRYYGPKESPSKVKALEDNYAKYLGTRHCLALNSCTSALISALVAAGVVGPRWPLHATVFALGAANGAFSIAAIGSMMRLAGEGRASREGVRMGLWGASQAISFGVGGLAGAVASDIARRFIDSPGTAYAVVFGAEALLFLWAAALAAGIETRAPQRRTRRWAWTRSTPTMPS